MHSTYRRWEGGCVRGKAAAAGVKAASADEHMTRRPSDASIKHCRQLHKPARMLNAIRTV